MIVHYDGASSFLNGVCGNKAGIMIVQGCDGYDRDSRMESMKMANGWQLGTMNLHEKGIS